ncbi:MAG TPA: hypothetical protein VL084_16080 [Thermoanaerobaculia bacterium]|nr:hypothetical protein [Thermoanaerobaculia bacterium]
MSWPLEAALLHAAFFLLGVLLPGAAALSLLPPADDESGRPRALLRLAAAGVLWNTAELAAVLALWPPGPIPRAAVAAAVFGADALLVLAAFLLRRGRLRDLLLQALRGVPPLLAGLAIACGLVALRAFPYVADCPQVPWAEGFLTGVPIAGNSGAAGFSAWIFFPGLLASPLPLVSSGAGARLPLFLLAFLAARALLLAAGVRRIAFGTGLFLLLLLGSTVGRVGLFELGKDSLFGLVFGMAYAAALPRSRPAEGRRDRALFFGAAVLLGVITLPFLAVVTALDLARRLPEGGLRGEGRALALVAVPAALPALLTMSRVPPGVLFALAAAAVILLLALPDRPFAIRTGSPEKLARFVPLLLFALLALAGLLLMPTRLEIPFGLDAAGHPILEAHFPLNGRTPFPLYLIAGSGPRHVLAVASLAGALFYLLRPPRRREPSLVVLALAPLVVSVTGLVLARLPAPPLAPRHIWDLVKDVPQWLTAPFWGLFAVLAVDDAADRALPGRASDGLLAIGLSAALLAGFAVKRKTVSWTLRPAALTPDAGHQDADVAALFHSLWNQRDTRRLVVPRSSFARPYSALLADYAGTPPILAEAADPESLRMATSVWPALVVGGPDVERRLAELYRGESLEMRAVLRLDASGESLLRIATASGR